MAKAKKKVWITAIFAALPEAYSADAYNDPERRERPGIHSYRWFQGPRVPGNTMEEAQAFCDENGLGYCKVIGEAV